MTDFNEWAEKMNMSFNKDIRGVEEERKFKIKDSMLNSSLMIETSLIDFMIKPKMLPKHQRMIQSLKTDNEPEYDTIQDVMASILSDISVDKELTKEFWVSLDEETGYLSDIFAVVSEKLVELQKEGISFRKN